MEQGLDAHFRVVLAPFPFDFDIKVTGQVLVIHLWLINFWLVHFCE